MFGTRFMRVTLKIGMFQLSSRLRLCVNKNDEVKIHEAFLCSLKIIFALAQQASKLYKTQLFSSQVSFYILRLIPNTALDLQIYKRL